MGAHGSRKNGQRKKRVARGAGRLYKRAPGGKDYPPDSPVNAPYWLQYSIPNPTGSGRGQCLRIPLRDEQGNPITDGARAEAERRRIVAPIQTGNHVDTLKAIQARLKDAKALHVQAVEEANPPLRIRDAWQAYLSAPERPDSGRVTLRQYEGHWARFQSWLEATHPDADYLRDVTPAIAGGYASDLAQAGLSANRFNKHIGFQRLLFRVLADAARIASNPFAKIKRKIQRPHSRRELTIPELTAILNKADGAFALLLYLGACTGLRLGDCATLEWGEVDLARGIIRRIPNKTAKSGKPVVVGIPPALHERLSETPARKQTGYVMPDMAERYGRDVALLTNAVKAHVLDCGIDVHAPGTGQRIKRKPDGTPERDEKTGMVTTEDTGKSAVVDVGFHSLRHTWVSMHAAAGTPGAIVQASVGHANPSMTQHYTHVSDVTARDVAMALPVFAGKGISTPRQDPLPLWARALAETLTRENVDTIRAKLLE